MLNHQPLPMGKLLSAYLEDGVLLGPTWERRILKDMAMMRLRKRFKNVSFRQPYNNSYRRWDIYGARWWEVDCTLVKDPRDDPMHFLAPRV
jgi:hypothetical protein